MVEICRGGVELALLNVRLVRESYARRAMPSESRLREKFRKIETLFADAGMTGKRLATETACLRLRSSVKT